MEVKITLMATAVLNTSRKSIKRFQKMPDTSFYMIPSFCLMYWLLALKKYEGAE